MDAHSMGESPSPPDSPKSPGKHGYTLEVTVEEELSRTMGEYRKFIEMDPRIEKSSTSEFVVDILSRLQRTLTQITNEEVAERDRLYYLLHNGTVLIMEISHKLRSSNFSHLAQPFLCFCILCLDATIVLMTVKYLPWRVKVYTELALAYSDTKALKSAYKVIIHAQKKLKYIEDLEMQDPPVPEANRILLAEGNRSLVVYECKFGLQSGSLTPEAWKKRIEELKVEKNIKYMATVESLKCEWREANRIVQPEELPPWKAQACKLACEIINKDVSIIKTNLVERVMKKQRDQEKTLALGQEEADIEGIIEQYTQMDKEMIKEKVWKPASKAFPLQMHVELLKHCYQNKLWTQFDELMDSARIRMKFRRYEVPYLATIDIMASPSRDANIPNGFEKLPEDLNVAHLKEQLAYLRSQAQKAPEHVSSTRDPKKKGGKDKKEEEEKKKEPPAKGKKEPPKKPPPKGKIDPKKGAVTSTKEEAAVVEEETEGRPMALESELARIDHTFMNLIIQRTRKKDHAICGIDIVFAKETEGPPLADHEYALALPLQQHIGIQQKTGKVPFLLFRRTANALKDEQDNLSLITDIKILVCKNPNFIPPMGYHKIDLDLRQTPKNLERLPNLEYIYICYQTEEDLLVFEREFECLICLSELERSFTKVGEEGYATLEEPERFLSLTFNIEIMNNLLKTMKESLLGPCGDLFLDKRLDFVFDICHLVWAKYISPVQKNINFFVEMKNQDEIGRYVGDGIRDLISSTEQHLVPILTNLHFTLTKLPTVDGVFLSHCSLYLGSLLESNEEYRQSVQILRSSISEIVQYRENYQKRGLEGCDGPHTTMSVTCDNYKIQRLGEQIVNAVKRWELVILREERARERKEKGINVLERDEADEEEFEILRAEGTVQTLLREEGYADKPIQKADTVLKLDGLLKKAYSENESILHGLHTDLLIALYRVELKLASQMKTINEQTKTLMTQQGIATLDRTKGVSVGLKNKMTIGKGKTATKIKNDYTNLQKTLQEAGKLPPPKPVLEQVEKILLSESNQNPYHNALLHMQMALNKSNMQEQKSLLIEALKFIQGCEEMEDKLCKLCLENAVYIEAAQRPNIYQRKTIASHYPYHFLTLPRYHKSCKVPEIPVFVGRSSTCISMLLPYFRPKGQTKYKMEKMALYGKPAGSGIAVSLNNTEYKGTGLKQEPGSVALVSGLMPNEKYVFASAAYSKGDYCPNGIGQTSPDIVALLPLPISILYSYLADISFKLGNFHIARRAAERICSLVLEKNEFKSNLLDSRINPVMAYRLNFEYISALSLVELAHISKSFLILSKCYIVQLSNRKKKSPSVGEAYYTLEHQKTQMRITNYMICSLELAISTHSHIASKQCISTLYNHLLPFLHHPSRSPLLLQPLLKCHFALYQIPPRYWDSNLRQVSAALTYELGVSCFQNKEGDLYKRVLNNELRLHRRMWHLLVSKKRILAPESEQREPTEEEPSPSPVYITEKQYNIEEREKEGGALEEVLASWIQYLDYASTHADKWRSVLTNHQEQVTGTLPEDTITHIQGVPEFWAGIKDNSEQTFGTLQSMKDSGTYLEYCSKCIRRMSESEQVAHPQLLSYIEDITLPKNITEYIEEKVENKKLLLKDDVVEKERKRYELLESKFASMKNDMGEYEALKMEQVRKQLMKEIEREEELMKTKRFTMRMGGDTQLQTEEDSCLWISEILYIKAGILFSHLLQTMDIQKAAGQPNFLDISQLDFAKISEYFLEEEDKLLEKQHEGNIIEENKPPETTPTPKEEKGKGKPGAKGKEALVEDDIHIPWESRFADIVSTLCEGSEFAIACHSWVHLENIIRLMWNILKYTLASPFTLKQSNSWTAVNVLAENTLMLIEYKRRGFSLRPSLQGGGIPGRGSVRFAVEPSVIPGGSSNDEGFDISLYANVICYGAQCLLVVEKWESLIDLCNRFNKSSENKYAANLLPFTIHAQEAMLRVAAQQTQVKKRQLEDRVLAFEKWKASQKRKKTRAAILTGEIPPEEVEFKKDNCEISYELFKLENVEKLLMFDKKESEELMGLIKRDSNTALESLYSARKNINQYAYELLVLRGEEQEKGKNNPEVRDKKMLHKQIFTSGIIANYKKTIEYLRRRQENFYLIQALNELGNLFYADGQLKEAEVHWNDSLDTIFQKLYVLKDFRSLFKNVSNIASSFGVKQTMIGIVLLGKLIKYSYYNDQDRLRECVHLGGYLTMAPLLLCMPHPQQYSQQALYQLREFVTGLDLFEDFYELEAGELIESLDILASYQIDMNLFEKAIPTLVLYEWVSSDISASLFYTIKARILRVIALSQLGYHAEAVEVYLSILNTTDLPNCSIRKSHYYLNTRGKNVPIQQGMKYQNHLSPEDPNNAGIIKELMNREISPELRNGLSPCFTHLLHYARGLLLFRMVGTQNINASMDKQEERMNAIRRIQEILRSSLKGLSLADDLLGLLSQICERREWVASDLGAQGEVDNLTEKLNIVASEHGVNEQEMNSYYNNREEEKSYSQMRSERQVLILRIRILLSEVFECQGLLLEAYQCARTASSIFQQYCYGCTNSPEDTEDLKSELFSIPEGVVASGGGGGAAPGRGGRGQPPKAVPKEDPKKGRGKGGKEDAKEEKLMGEVGDSHDDKLDAANLLRRKYIESVHIRHHADSFYWLMVKRFLLAILLKEGRYIDSKFIIKEIKAESAITNDSYSVRIALQFEAYIHIFRGEIKDGIAKFNEAKTLGEEKHHLDPQLAFFITDFGEFFYSEGYEQDALLALKDSRLIMWRLLKDYGLEIEPVDINKDYENKLLRRSENLVPTYNLVGAQSKLGAAGGKGAPAKGGKEAAGKAPAKGAPVGKGAPKKGEEKGGGVEHELLGFEEKRYPYKEEIELEFELTKGSENSSGNPENIYIRYLEDLIRIDVRYSHIALVSDGNYSLAERVLGDTLKLLNRTLNVSHMLHFHAHLILAISNKLHFINSLEQFQGEYLSKAIHNPKYIPLIQLVPSHGLALGPVMQNLPNFTELFNTKYSLHIRRAEDNILKAVEIAKSECVLYEFEREFDASRAFLEASEINYYLGEYRERVEYKYCDIGKIMNNCLNREGEGEEEKRDKLLGEVIDKGRSKEACEQVQYIRRCKYYMDLLQRSEEIKNELLHNYQLLSQSNLIDPSRVPKEVIFDIYQSDYISKMNYKDIPHVLIKHKTITTSIDVLTYTNSLFNESKFFTVFNHHTNKLLAKIHRYLKQNLPNYTQKCCFDIKPFEPNDKTDLTGILQQGQIIMKWKETGRSKRSLFYILGSSEVIKPEMPEEVPEQPDLLEEYHRKERECKDSENIKFGFLHINSNKLSDLYQSIQNLLTKYRISEKQTGEKFNRDKKYLERELHENLEHLGSIFRRERKVDPTEETEVKEEKCIDLVTRFIPELNEETLQTFASMMNHQGINKVNINLNAVLRAFHSLRYIQ